MAVTSPSVADMSTNCARGSSEERHLPRPAAVGVAVVVELVHHDLVDRGIRTLAQGEVGEDLGRAADDRGVGVHRASRR